MPSKKKKYNARFPPARIKKIMQTDEEVGKVAAAVPVIISRALELFIDSLIEKTATITKEKHAKTLSTSHVKQAIHSEKTFDFLRDLVKNVPDHQAEDEDGGLIPSGSGTAEPKQKIPRPRKTREPSDKPAERPPGKRGPGRPRKIPNEVKKESPAAVNEHEDSEETETDEEQNSREVEQRVPDEFMPTQPAGVNTLSSLPVTEQGAPGPFMSPPSAGVAPVIDTSSGHAMNAQSTIESPQSSPHISYAPGSGTLHQMQPAFQTPVQSYPMHNIPIPQYQYPMVMPQGSPAQFNEFAPNPAFNNSNNVNSPFMPPMVSPFMPPFVTMPPAGFMVPPPPQEGVPYLNMYSNLPGAGNSVTPPQNATEHQTYTQKEPVESTECEMPLDMTVSGKQRSHSTTQPQPKAVSNQNDMSTKVINSPHGHRNHPGTDLQSGPSTHKQNRETNGPSNVNSTHNSSKQYDISPKKSAVKSSDSSGFNERFNNVEKSSVTKEKKGKVENSIEYENLSSLMNRQPVTSVNNEDDDDYDT